MQSVAAYYVLVASDLARKSDARARHTHSPRKQSRLAAAFAALVHPTRRSAVAAA